MTAAAGNAPAPRKAAVCLWFAHDAEDAARFYAATFPDTHVGDVMRTTAETPGGPAGSVLLVHLTLCGLPYLLLNGGADHVPNDCYSLQVYTDDQQETDRLWDAVVGNGGRPIQCGWCVDRWGYRWQITPRALMEAIADPDPAAAARAMAAMMAMEKIDIVAIEAARQGEGGDA